jgi:ATP phosphoribosyltransferase regulatory subunit
MNYQQKNAQLLYQQIKHKLLDVYDIFGYEEICLPLFEKYENYIKYKAVNEESLLKLIDRGGNILVIRPDATFHVLKTVQNMDKDIDRCCYMTNIFRFRDNNYEKNEVLQTGVELFDSSSPYADAEVIALAIASLKALDIQNIHIDLGHSQFVHAFLKDIGIRNDKDIAHYHHLLDNKNIISLTDSLSNAKIDDTYINQLCDIAMLFGSYDDVRKKAELVCRNKKMENILFEIDNIFKALKSFNVADYIHLDLGFSNPMNYYSGIIFKGYVVNHGEAVISGGRYDALAQQFANKKCACGFGHNIDVTIDVLLKKQQNQISKKTIILTGSDCASATLISDALRKRGHRCLMSFDDIENIIHLNNDIIVKVDQLYTTITQPDNIIKTILTKNVLLNNGIEIC